MRRTDLHQFNKAMRFAAGAKKSGYFIASIKESYMKGLHVCRS